MWDPFSSHSLNWKGCLSLFFHHIPAPGGWIFPSGYSAFSRQTNRSRRVQSHLTPHQTGDFRSWHKPHFISIPQTGRWINNRLAIGGPVILRKNELQGLRSPSVISTPVVKNEQNISPWLSNAHSSHAATCWNCSWDQTSPWKDPATFLC